MQAWHLRPGVLGVKAMAVGREAPIFIGIPVDLECWVCLLLGWSLFSGVDRDLTLSWRDGRFLVVWCCGSWALGVSGSYYIGLVGSARSVVGLALVD